MLDPKIDPLPKAIDKAFSTLSTHEPGTAEYKEVLNQITTLHKMKTDESPNPVSKETWVNAAVNLIGLVLVIRHEQFNVITGQAFGMIRRMK